MGVSTYAVFKRNVSPLEILDFLEKKTTIPFADRRNGMLPDVSKLNLTSTGQKDFHWINFQYKGEDRGLAVFSNGNCKCDYKDLTTDDVTLVSLGCWGSSVEIVKLLLDEFGGGWIDENDSDYVEYTKEVSLA
jgi:hypothetical protein